jgi:hypothetical protein
LLRIYLLKRKNVSRSDASSVVFLRGNTVLGGGGGAALVLLSRQEKEEEEQNKYVTIFLHPVTGFLFSSY